MEFIAWLGAFCLALCALPQAIKTMGEGRCPSISLGFLLLWWLGEICLGAYAYHLQDTTLLVNYVSNFVLTTIILRYKLLPR